jgi:molybdopterin-guanine dinucleotide biosynthesis protein A
VATWYCAPNTRESGYVESGYVGSGYVGYAKEIHFMNEQTDASIPELALAVLCGGESHRMGTSKALLDFQGEPMLLRTIRRLGVVCGGAHWVVAAAAQQLPHLPDGTTLLHDRAPRRGPLEGIVLATRAASRQPTITAVAIVGCDLPWLAPQLIGAMFAVLSSEADVVCVQDETRRHPLVAIYRPGVWQVAEARLAAGQLSLQSLLDELRSEVVDRRFVRQVDPSVGSLVNVNTLEDYQRALSR